MNRKFEKNKIINLCKSSSLKKSEIIYADDSFKLKYLWEDRGEKTNRQIVFRKKEIMRNKHKRVEEVLYINHCHLTN